MFALALLSCFVLVHSNEIKNSQPYKFGYSLKSKHGEQQHREESGKAGEAVVGSYGFTDAKGFYRIVHYIADKAGFRVQIKPNEPGTGKQHPSNVRMFSNDLTPRGKLKKVEATVKVAANSILKLGDVQGRRGYKNEMNSCNIS
ncbi:cuticle protein 16.8 [Caerostris darwini]|uniref:Cuticle protein 16.8 n=1 Tax=Caerostris darwini TaxID=1538125 RepID=A0AAV4VMH3_9ARAC|nr:cuticle protein 16.8 [Caerostris darwini]